MVLLGILKKKSSLFENLSYVVQPEIMEWSLIWFEFLFKGMSTPLGHFVSSPRERLKSDRRRPSSLSWSFTASQHRYGHVQPVS